jgi:hypothetical protein
MRATLHQALDSQKSIHIHLSQLTRSPGLHALAH